MFLRSTTNENASHVGRPGLLPIHIIAVPHRYMPHPTGFKLTCRENDVLKAPVGREDLVLGEDWMF